jgi:hypothetical protein
MLAERTALCSGIKFSLSIKKNSNQFLSGIFIIIEDQYIQNNYKITKKKI